MFTGSTINDDKKLFCHKATVNERCNITGDVMEPFWRRQFLSRNYKGNVAVKQQLLPHRSCVKNEWPSF